MLGCWSASAECSIPSGKFCFVASGKPQRSTGRPSKIQWITTSRPVVIQWFHQIATFLPLVSHHSATPIPLPTTGSQVAHHCLDGGLALDLNYLRSVQNQATQSNPQPAYGVYYEPNSNGLSTVFDNNEQDQESELPVQETDSFGDAATEMDDESTFFQLPPSIGQTAGLAIDSENHLVLFHRSARVWDRFSFTEDNKLNKSLGAIPNATLAVVDPNTGKVLAEHGKGAFYMPHGLTIDSQGDYWLTDVGSHQVIKLDKAFKPLLELGEKLVPGNDEKHFCKPTDVAVAKNGDFFVADGYCNSRIMKFNKDGKFLTSFGESNSDNPARAADRENQRIQCFAAGLSEGKHFHPRAFVPTGTFFTKAEGLGRVFAIREKQHYLVGVTNQDEAGQIDPQVFVMDMNTGKANTFAKGLQNAHALALNEFGDIFVSQINPNQIVKFSVPAET
uniref:peptidylamidoglycolate lyase n=1 Tax=Ditylenchus dipsaci TaxID=166011 RepID=A0A915EJ59_9BILA